MNIHSLKLKFLVILIGILGAVLLMQTYYFTPTLKTTEEHETLEAQLQIAQLLAATFELSFQQTVSEIEAIAKLPAIMSLENEQLDRTLSKMNRVTQFFNYYFITDPDGTWLSYPSKPHLQGKKIKNNYWINDILKNDRTLFLDVHLANSIDTLVSGFATPIRSANGEIKAIIRGVITVSDNNALLKQTKNIKIGQDGFVYIVDSQGQLIAHPDFSTTPENLNCVSEKEVFISTNGIHLDIIVPRKNLTKGLQQELEISESVEYISFGWGDREFYLETPTWNDFKLSTAVKAIFLISETARILLLLENILALL